MPAPSNSVSVSSCLSSYFSRVEGEYQAGRATEHSHRPYLKALLECLMPGIRATDEPKLIACGAPD